MSTQPGQLTVDLLEDALCAQVDTEMFFPEKGGTTTDAKRVCAGCPVRIPCLQVALDQDLDGVWGGTSVRERRRMRHEAAA